MKIYCIIATYNAEAWIRKCLKSILSSTIETQILVVDNLSTDRTADLIESEFPSVQLIRNQTNSGFGKANNIGLQKAYDLQCEYFFLLNQDAWVEPDTIEKLVIKLEENPEYGILSPMQYFDANHLDRKFKSYLKGIAVDLQNDLRDEIQEKIYPVPFVNAAVWLMSRNCVEKVGLFAPIFDHYGEDLNYAHRCRFHTVKIGVYPQAKAFHEREQHPPKEKGIPISKLLVRDKHYCFGVLLNLKHSYLRQWIFLLFTSIKDCILSVATLRFKTAFVILYRLKYSLLFIEFIGHRKQMMKSGAYLLKH